MEIIAHRRFEDFAGRAQEAGVKSREPSDGAVRPSTDTLYAEPFC